MTIAEFDKISEQYKDVDIKEFTKSEIDRVMSEILEKEHYETYRRLDLYIFSPIYVSIFAAFITFFINRQSDIFLRILIPLILLLCIISSFVLFWNIFRTPKKIILIKEILHSSINEFLELNDTFSKNITKPYLKLFFEYNLLINDKFNTIDNSNEIKQKFLEIEDVIRPISHKFAYLLIQHKNETILNQPLESDKYPKIQFFLDNFSESYRYYVISLSFFSLLIFLIYTFIINFW
jgi:hypothetical protein